MHRDHWFCHKRCHATRTLQHHHHRHHHRHHPHHSEHPNTSSRFLRNSDASCLCCFVRLVCLLMASASPAGHVANSHQAVADFSLPCSCCGAHGQTKRCSCKAVRYCSTRCQKAHWPAHKPSCQGAARVPSLPGSVRAPRTSVSKESAIAIASAAQVQIEADIRAEFRAKGSVRKVGDIIDARSGTSGPVPSSSLQILCSATAATQHLLKQPCVNCGIICARFCDGGEEVKTINKGLPCFARDRLPRGDWLPYQRTPLCYYCDNNVRACHFCRRIPWCTPRPHNCKETSRQTALFLVTLEITRPRRSHRKTSTGSGCPGSS